MNKTPTKLSHIIHVPHIVDEANLYFMESEIHIPFDIKRIYLISDVEQHAVRGSHAHKKTKQVLFCIKGSIKIKLDDSDNNETITLDNPTQGIYLDVYIWHEMIDFSPDTILMVVASERYDESDYIRNYLKFLEFKGKLPEGVTPL